MANTAKIKTLLEGTDQIAPRTKVKAVSDDNGNALNNILDGINTNVSTNASNISANTSDISELKEDIGNLQTKADASLYVDSDGYICLKEN